MQVLYTFFKKPSLKIEKITSNNDKFKHFFKVLLFAVIFAFTGIIIMKIIDSIVFHSYKFSIFEAISKHNNKHFVLDNFWYNCFYVTLLGPFIEEIIFRFPLNLKKWNVAIGISMLCFMFIGDKVFIMSIYSFYTWMKFGAVFFILMIFYFMKQKYFDIIKNKYFGLYFYLLCLSFGFMHVSNFIHLIPNKLIFLVPFFVLPQISLGIFTGYIRIKNGFYWGLLMHIFFNLPMTLLQILTHK